MRVKTWSGEFEVQTRDDLPIAVRIVNSIIEKLILVPQGRTEVRRDELPETARIDWPRIVNRLKILASVDPVAFSVPRAGRFELFQDHDHYWVRVEFPPGMEPESVRLVWRPAPVAA